MKTNPARFPLPRRGVRLPAHPAFVTWVAGVVILGALMAFERLSPTDGLGSIFGLGIVTAIAARLGRQPRDEIMNWRRNRADAVTPLLIPG